VTVTDHDLSRDAARTPNPSWRDSVIAA